MKALISIMLLALLAGACGDETGSTDDGALQTTAAPETRVAPGGAPSGDWRLTEGVEVVADYRITLSITGDQAGGRAACNSYGGTITGDGSTISFVDLFQTEMACEPDAMRAETEFLAALATVEEFALAGDRLTLTGPDVRLVFEPEPAVPTADLVDTRWILDTLIEGETAATVAGDPAYLVLSSDGSFTATTGCRTVTGEWLEAGGTIVVPNMSAEGECPDELWKQDSLVITVLEDEFRAEVEGDRLRLTSMDGDGLVFRAGS